MAKRARPDTEARPIPRWLAVSGVDARALDQLLEWMEVKKLGFARMDGLPVTHACGRCHAFEPIPEYEAGDPCVTCSKCATQCECCEAVCLDLVAPQGADNPHSAVCADCDAETCPHCDDSGRDFCEGCGRLCRDTLELVVGNETRAVCNLCAPDKFR